MDFVGAGDHFLRLRAVALPAAREQGRGDSHHPVEACKQSQPTVCRMITCADVLSNEVTHRRFGHLNQIRQGSGKATPFAIEHLLAQTVVLCEMKTATPDNKRTKRKC